MHKSFPLLKHQLREKENFPVVEEPTIAQIYSSLISSTKGKKKEIHNPLILIFEGDRSETNFSEIDFEEGHSSRVVHRRRPS